MGEGKNREANKGLAILWAYRPEGVKGEYLLDDTIRIRTAAEAEQRGLQALDGIKRIRDVVRAPGKVARLVGLSGLGKTRLVQALFDDRIGEGSLDPALVFYTDMSDEPDPNPVSLASELVASREQAIIVVDNCSPGLHRQ